MRKLLILIAVLSFCLSTASALQISAPTLSGDRGTDVSTTFTITNDGTVVLSNITPSSSADAKYNVKFENVPQSLAPGATVTITIKGKIPVDFDAGKKSIGSITVTSTAPSAPVNSTLNSTSSSSAVLGSHLMTPSNQTPQQATLPVGMSASNDCGTNTQDPGTPIIGQWHVGNNGCDSVNDIEVSQPFQGAVDSGWARIHSNDFTNYWVGAVSLDCNGQVSAPPNNWLYGGKIHTGPGVCDGQMELQSGDSGWLGFYSHPSAAGKLIFVIAENKCGGAPQSVPSTGVILGKVRTGPGKCDGAAEAFAHDGTSLDSGSMFVVFVPTPQAPPNGIPVGELEKVNMTGVHGWAYDADIPASTVHIYLNGKFWKETDADKARPDLVSIGKIPNPNHGFIYTFTTQDLTALGNGTNQSFHVYAINSPASENNPMLNGSPKVLAAFGSPSNSSGNSSGGSGSGSGSGSSKTSTTATATLSMEAHNRLVIEKVKITCDKLETVTDGSSIDGVSPGQTCYLTVKVENTFTTDVKIEDITIEADSENSDVDGDDADISSLDAGDSEEKTLELKVDEDADEGDAEITITVEGKDENGAQHSDVLKFTLEIERLKHDLPISKITVSPSEARRCEVSRIDVLVYVENDGKNDEDKVAVELSVPALSFTKKISDLSIDEGEEGKVTFSIPVSSTTAFGSFKATAKSFYDNVAQSQSKTADIKIMKCEDDEPEVVSGPVVTPPPFVPQDSIVIVPQEEPKENSGLFGSAVLTGVLVLANLIALSVLGVMAYGYFRKPKDPLTEQFNDEKSFEEVSQPKDYY